MRWPGTDSQKVTDNRSLSYELLNQDIQSRTGQDLEIIGPPWYLTCKPFATHVAADILMSHHLS